MDWQQAEISSAQVQATGCASCCAIIPAYNEAPRIAPVIAAALATGLFEEVVVVDDGSNDSTDLAAVEAGARVLTQAQNGGKARAMLAGLKATSAQVVCFIDADLLAVSPEHIRLLVEPVKEGRVAAQLAVFSGGRMATTLAQKITPMISGQRCLRRELLEGFDGWDSGFGIETALNAWLLRAGVGQRIVHWPGAGQVMKEEKRGLLRGFLARLQMYWDIITTWLRSKRRI